MADRDSQHGIEDFTRIYLRPLASSIPLGFFAFGVGVFMQSSMQLGLIPQSQSQMMAIILGAFVAPAQALAAIFAFLGRETLGATVLAVLSFSWLSTSLVTIASGSSMPNNALGLFDLCITAILLASSVTAMLGKPLLGAIIGLASARFFLTGLFELTASTGVQTAAGIIGFVIAAVSLYGGLAFGIEDVNHQAVLPLGRRGEAAEAFEGDLSDQVGPVEQEAGVRKQL